MPGGTPNSVRFIEDYQGNVHDLEFSELRIDMPNNTSSVTLEMFNMVNIPDIDASISDLDIYFDTSDYDITMINNSPPVLHYHLFFKYSGGGNTLNLNYDQSFTYFWPNGNSLYTVNDGIYELSFLLDVDNSTNKKAYVLWASFS